MNTQTKKVTKTAKTLDKAPAAEALDLLDDQTADLASENSLSEADLAELEEFKAAKAAEDEANVAKVAEEAARKRLEELAAEMIELRAKLPKVEKAKNVGVGKMVYRLLDSGLTNKEIHKQVCEHYGNENTTYACIAWYRNELKNR